MRYKLPADIDLEKLAPYFERDYFAWGGKGQPIGYAGFYTDFPDNLRLVKMILDRKPKSVLDLGCARGFIVKRLNDLGIPSWGIDISRYCWKTRVTENVVTGSITDMRMFEDKQFDLGVSFETFEHIPEKLVDQALKEVARVCNRAFISLSYEESVLPNDIDITHVTLKPARWWEDKFAPYGFELNYRKEEPKLIPYANPGPDAKVGLNIGSFVSMFLDTEQTKWYNIDKLDLRSYAVTYRYRFIQHDVTKGLPFPDGSVRYIFASHILEHFTREELNFFLREALRVMELGGIARFATPDLRILTRKYLQGEMGEFDDLNPEYEAAPTQAEKYQLITMSGHKSVFDYESLKRILSNTGFTSIRAMPPFIGDATMRRETFDQYPTLSLYVEATKPEPLYKKYLEGKIEEGMQPY